jgi:hypothetical protein
MEQRFRVLRTVELPRAPPRRPKYQRKAAQQGDGYDGSTRIKLRYCQGFRMCSTGDGEREHHDHLLHARISPLSLQASRKKRPSMSAAASTWPQPSKKETPDGVFC